MYKYVFFVIIISIMLSACQKNQQPDTTLTTIAKTTSAAAETTSQKDTGAYDDRTAVIPDSANVLIENPIFVFSLIPDTDTHIGISVDELYRTSTSVVRGTITDHTYQPDGMIYYSFGVSEVLYGEEIKPETIITVSCEQRVTPLELYRENKPDSYPQFTKEEVKRTYVIESFGEPFAQIGEEYILFLSDGQNVSSNNITGNWYFVTSGYAGKFKRNTDGLYERTIPEFLTELNVSKTYLDASGTELNVSETGLNHHTETNSGTAEDFGKYEDRTAKISNSFQVNMENAILIPAILTDDPRNPKTYVYDTMNDLCRHSDSIVRGNIIDLAYQSDVHYKRTTYYSFAVSEVLAGEQIKPGTIISVQEDNQGYLPLKLYREQVFSEAFSPKYEGEEEDRAYLTDTLDKPLVKIGEEYVLFLSSGSPSEEVTGNYYSVTSGYAGKFKRNEDGLYERAVPEMLKGLVSPFTDCLSLEELKEQIISQSRPSQ